MKGIDYPAAKDELIRKANENGAANEVTDTLKKLPSEEFGGSQDVMIPDGQIKC